MNSNRVLGDLATSFINTVRYMQRHPSKAFVILFALQCLLINAQDDNKSENIEIDPIGEVLDPTRANFPDFYRVDYNFLNTLPARLGEITSTYKMSSDKINFIKLSQHEKYDHISRLIQLHAVHQSAKLEVDRIGNEIETQLKTIHKDCPKLCLTLLNKTPISSSSCSFNQLYGWLNIKIKKSDQIYLSSLLDGDEIISIEEIENDNYDLSYSCRIDVYDNLIERLDFLTPELFALLSHKKLTVDIIGAEINCKIYSTANNFYLLAQAYWRAELLTQAKVWFKKALELGCDKASSALEILQDENISKNTHDNSFPIVILPKKIQYSPKTLGLYHMPKIEFTSNINELTYPLSNSHTKTKDIISEFIQFKLASSELPIEMIPIITNNLLSFYNRTEKTFNSAGDFEVFLHAVVPTNLYIIRKVIAVLEKFNLLNNNNVSQFIMHLDVNTGDLSELAKRNFLTQEIFDLLISTKNSSYLVSILTKLFDNSLLSDEITNAVSQHSDIKSIDTAIQYLSDHRCLTTAYLEIVLKSLNPISMANGCIKHSLRNDLDNLSFQELLLAANASNPGGYIIALYLIKDHHGLIPEELHKVVQENNFLLHHPQPDFLIKILIEYNMFDKLPQILKHENISLLHDTFKKINLAQLPVEKYSIFCLTTSHLKELDAILDFLRENIFKDNLQKNIENMDSLISIIADNTLNTAKNILAKFSRRYLLGEKIDQEFFDNLIKNYSTEKKIQRPTLFIEKTNDQQKVEYKLRTDTKEDSSEVKSLGTVKKM